MGTAVTPADRMGVVSRLAATVMAVALLAGLAAPIRASHNQNARWKDVPVAPFQNYIRYWFHSSVPTGSFRSRITDGAGSWNSANRELFFALGNSSNKLITITYEDLAFPNGDSLAISMTFAGSCFPDICTGSMAYNTTPGIAHFYLGTTTDPTTIPNNHYDLWSVAAHEFGHQVSLTHPGIADQWRLLTMYELLPPQTIYQRSRHVHDTQGINALYPPF